MKQKILSLAVYFLLVSALALLSLPDIASAQRRGGGSVSVRGYTRKDGTYVPPHYRSAPDSSFYNNWSTRGNINPFTGKEGTRISPPNRDASVYSPAPSLPSSSNMDPGSLSNRSALPTRPRPEATLFRSMSFDDYFEQGKSYYDAGQYANAVRSFQSAVRLQPDDPKGHYFLGISLMLSDRYREALKSFTKTTDLYPESPGPYFCSGWIYFAYGNEQKSIAAFKATVRLTPNYAPAHYGLGAAYHHFGRYGRAVRPLKEAIRIDPNYSDALYELGAVYFTLGRSSLAWEQYKALSLVDSSKAADLYSLLTE